jgi:excisionase family DNA binding protein
MLSTEQAAKQLGVNKARIKQWASQGRIPFVRLGRRLLFPADITRPTATKGRAQDE